MLKNNILEGNQYKGSIKALLVVVILSSLGGCSTMLNGKHVYQADGVAIGGYDPVAYFKGQQAVPGDIKYTTVYDDARWLFSSKSNLNAFLSTPTQFVPQYGGYCAYAMTQGYVVSSDPKLWSIINKKLYLNNNQLAQKLWLQNTSEKIVAADKEWGKKIKSSQNQIPFY